MNTSYEERHHQAPRAPALENCFDPATGALTFGDPDATPNWSFAGDFPFKIPQAVRENIRQIDAYNTDFGCMPKTALKCQNARHLLFMFCKIESVPDEIGDLRQLESLCLGACRIRRISARLGELKQLKLLHLSFNHLQTAPASLGNCRELGTLDLARNRLRTLPASLGALTELHTLDISDNRLSRLPDIFASLSKLERLCLDGNPLIELPLSLLQLPSLKSLSCGDGIESPRNARRFAAACAERGVRLVWNRNAHFT